MRSARVGVWVILMGLSAAGALAQEHQHPSGGAEKLGTVRFTTSCSAAAKPRFDRGVALLHSFEFKPALEEFGAALEADPRCAIAGWGMAMCRWGNPFAAGIRPASQVQHGLDAVARAERAGATTERERAWIAAASRLYAGADTLDQRARTVAYERAMSELAAAYPDDREAAVFHALSLAASALPTDKTYANQLKAGAILEKLAPEAPDHPGIAHYIIHSYDVPALAGKALEAARRYSTIAPTAPHALHMPSHTFTRVGQWQESIDTNIASAVAARRDRSTAEELHALDYQAYAYLQTAQDAPARRVVDELPAVATRFDPDAIGSAAPASAGYFALAAIPARYALERGAWAEAAALEARETKFPYTEAMTHFARALGAARIGQLATARASVEALGQIRERLAAAKEAFWAEQVDVQRRGASAWLAMAEGRTAEALTLMREAADREDLTDKNAVTPGPLAPARELLGEMLLAAKEPAKARAEFQQTLKKEPNRFRAVYGAARAAADSGDRAGARTQYALLLKIAERGTASGRPELAEARTFVAASPR